MQTPSKNQLYFCCITAPFLAYFALLGVIHFWSDSPAARPRTYHSVERGSTFKANQEINYQLGNLNPARWTPLAGLILLVSIIGELVIAFRCCNFDKVITCLLVGTAGLIVFLLLR